LIAISTTASAAGITLTTVADNTLYEDATGSLSNGAGQFMYAGKGSAVRRALLRFDIAGNVPVGSTITGAALTLNMSRTNPTNSTVTLTLYRLTSPWGEGTSDAGDPGGSGVAATPGDATWLHTFSPTTLWTAAGGDYLATPSAAAVVTGLGAYTWTSAQLAADVQDMLDDPGSNHGWILIGEEATTVNNSKRFDTHEHVDANRRPRLVLEYDDPPVGVETSQWSAVKALFR
jgi:hypothetical protein